MNNRDYQYLRLATELAKTSLHDKTRVGAVLVSKRDIISVGVNSSIKSHPDQKFYNMRYRGFASDICKHLVHAELDCLLRYRAMRIELVDLVLYISRVFKSGEVVSARPCRACMGAIKDYGLKVIYYTTPDGVVEERLH